MKCGCAYASLSYHSGLDIENNIDLHIFSYIHVQKIYLSGIECIRALFGT